MRPRRSLHVDRVILGDVWVPLQREVAVSAVMLKIFFHSAPPVSVLTWRWQFFGLKILILNLLKSQRVFGCRLEIKTRRTLNNMARRTDPLNATHLECSINGKIDNIISELSPMKSRYKFPNRNVGATELRPPNDVKSREDGINRILLRVYIRFDLSPQQNMYTFSSILEP